MNKFKHFLGIDVSKEFFDAVLLLEDKKEQPVHNQFPNDYKRIRALCKWLKEMGATGENTLICLEHTGMYGKLIIKYLIGFNFSLWVEMSLRIIKSMGIQRGKNDKIDAERIALYALKNVESATIYKAPRQIVDKIRTLLSLRDKLTIHKTTLLRYDNEMASFDSELTKLCEKHNKNTLAGIKKDLLSIEKQLDKFINEDENLNKLFYQVTSVTGIGKITALYLICFTNEFTMYSNPRQLACYAGVVPFEHTSGKSIKGRAKVHYMANKKLKKQLHLCAMAATVYDPEIKQYYQRKVAEGKSKMLVINNVRNKLVHRICSCIRNDKFFEIKKLA